MTFQQAYKYAMEHSEVFRKHDSNVKAAQNSGMAIPCLIFSLEPETTFYYGFDGVNVQKGKHPAKRAIELLNMGLPLIIF